MKISTFSLLFMFLASISIMSGCQKQAPKIGVLIHEFDTERWKKDKDYLVDNLNKLGAEVMLQVADNNQKNQILQAEEMIKNGAKVLIVVPVNQDESAKIVEMAHNAGVKVISYHRMINNCNLDYYVSANNKYTGEIEAKYMLSVQPKGNFALIGGSKHDNNSMRLFLGQMSVLQPAMERGDITLVYSEFGEAWTKEDGYRQANIILENYAEGLTGIICGNDNQALGALTALKENGLEGKIHIIAQDAELTNVKEIIKGNQTATILKPLKETAAAAAGLAIALAQDEPITTQFEAESNGKILVKSIFINTILVNKNNIETTVVASGYHTSAQINM